MKRLILTTLLIVVLGTLSFAQTVQKTYYFDNPTVTEVNGYDMLKFDGTMNHGIVGEATLPWQSVSLLLPQNTDAQSINVEYSDFVEIEGTYNLLPYQAARPLSSTEPLVFAKNEDFYKSAESYPQTTFSKVNTQYLNGCSFAFARFTPVRYVPATGKVSYAKSVTVTVELTASRSDRSSKLWMTPEVEKRVERLAQNPEAVQAYKTRARTIGGYELLVITPQEWVSHFDEYVAFYEARGLRTHVTALEGILANFDGRDDAEKVRAYISQEYENEGVMMVLLGGDSNVVPWRALYCNVYDEEIDNLPADMYFVCLDGTWDDNNNGLWGEPGEDDLLPELAVGRMPFNNETQFNNMMHKTLEYQANPILGEFHTVILGGEHLGDGYFGSTDLERIIGTSNDFDYTTTGVPEDYDFVKYYATYSINWSGSTFKKIINDNGGQYIHHVGHANTGTVAGWDVMTMNDGSFAQLDGVHHNYNFFHSHGCVCGDFTHNCILERMVNISTGFVAVTGNSRYGWYQPWGDGMAAHLHREFMDAYYHDRLPYIGTAFVEMKIMTAPYVEWDQCMRWNDYDINILGDVAVCPWLDEPFRPEVSYASALTLGSTSMPVTVTKHGEAQSNFRCSIFHGDDLLAFGITDNNGVANVVFAEGLNVADSLKLIITGPNAYPQTINIIGIDNNTAFVYPQSTDIHGDFVFGRSISMDVDFKNAGTVDANNVIATLSTNSNYITLSKSTVSVGTVNAGESVMIADAFDLVVADNIPDESYIDFVMTCIDGTNVWNRDVCFQAVAPVLKINALNYEEASGNMNGFLDPGETVSIVVNGTNKGHYMAENPYLHGTVNSEYITIVNNDEPFENVAAGEEFEENLDIFIAEDTPDGTIIEITVNAVTGQYTATKKIVLTVGTVKEDFETGDFSHLNWKHAGDASWYVTETESHSGTYSVRSPQLIKNQESSIIIEIENTTDGEISFYIKTDTRKNKDLLMLFIDDIHKQRWSGDTDWTQASFNLPAGTHTIEWRYDTAPSGDATSGVCWVDDITFPGNTMVLNVETVAEDNKVAVYPNPANDFIYVKGENIQTVEIYNAIGLKIMSKNVSNSESINIADFTNGIYFVRILDKNGIVSTEKIIKR